MEEVTDEQTYNVGLVLNDDRNSLKDRFRALFTLKNIGSRHAVETIADGFDDSSALLKHELAYCLGQMKHKSAIPVLTTVLKDTTEHPMVRHEAAEALAAIGDTSVIELLKEHTADPVLEVAQTCQLALDRFNWLSEVGDTESFNSPYGSVDPAPPMPYDSSTSVLELKEALLDESAGLFNQYQAMFALRNIGNDECVTALCEGLTCGDALFRHEIAFVLGQLQSSTSVPALVTALNDTTQNEMVRHECAEALGAIATLDCTVALKKFLNDPSQVVRESCVLALDMADYESSGQFQYADTLLKVESSVHD